MIYTCSKSLEDKKEYNGKINYNNLKELLEIVSENDTIYLLDDSYYGKFYFKTKNLTVIGLDTYSKLTYDVSHGDIIRECDGGDGVKVYGTTGSSSVTIKPQALNIRFENVIFENSYKRVLGKRSGQAVALKSEADNGKYINCKFISCQDTLYLEGNNNIIDNSYIEGDVDFIFGSGDNVISNSEIGLLKVLESEVYICAPSTYLWNKYGLLFINDKFISLGNNKKYLGRGYYPSGAIGPVKPRCMFLNCDIPADVELKLITMHEKDPKNYIYYYSNCKYNGEIKANYDDIGLDEYYITYYNSLKSGV